MRKAISAAFIPEKMTKAIIAAFVAAAMIGIVLLTQEVKLLAQEEVFPVEGAEPSVAWVAKVAEAIAAKTAVTLTADEVQALGRAYAALEQRQVADIAFSETHVYVVSPAGTVVLSKEFP